MLRKSLVALIGFSLLLGLTAATAAAQDKFTAQLTANKFGPKPADTQASGEVVFSLVENGKGLAYELTLRNIEDVYMAHLHLGPEDGYGPIVVWLYPAEGRPKKVEGKFDGVLAKGVIHAKDLTGTLQGKSLNDLLAAMRAGQSFVNVHTAKYVPGELRGQVR